jgi:hypothetical protein
MEDYEKNNLKIDEEIETKVNKSTSRVITSSIESKKDHNEKKLLQIHHFDDEFNQLKETSEKSSKILDGKKSTKKSDSEEEITVELDNDSENNMGDEEFNCNDDVEAKNPDNLDELNYYESLRKENNSMFYLFACAPFYF